jgi:hypothetical protein
VRSIALIVRMAYENFLWGAADAWKLLKLASTYRKPRYPATPRRSYPSFQTCERFCKPSPWDSYDQLSWATGHHTSFTRARRRIERVVRCAAEFREALSCWPIKPSPRLHPFRSSDACDLADRRTIYGARMPVGFALDRAYWPMAGVRPLPYRSRASPGPTLPALMNFAQTSRTCRRNPLVSRHKFAPPVCGGLLVQTVTRGRQFLELTSRAQRLICDQKCTGSGYEGMDWGWCSERITQVNDALEVCRTMPARGGQDAIAQAHPARVFR